MQNAASHSTPANPLRREIVGVEAVVPLLDGRQVPYVNLDNAASTFKPLPVLQELLPLKSRRSVR